MSTYYNRFPANKFYKKNPLIKSTPNKKDSKEMVSTSVKKYIKKAIASQEEVKVINTLISFNPQGYTLSALATGWYSTNVFPVCPYGGFMNIQQGTGQADRIGNKIRTKRVVMDYIITPRGYDATLNPVPTPQDVKIWICHARDDPNILPAQGDFTSFFQYGDTSISPTATISDLLLEPNEDLFKVFTTRSHKVGFASASTGAAGVNPTFAFYANNDYGLNCRGRIDLTKFIPKTLHFNDNAPYPNNSCVFAVVEAVPAVGGTNGIYQPLLMTFTLKYEFSDD